MHNYKINPSFDNKLKVLHVTPFFPPDKGGISNLVNCLCHELMNLDCDIKIMTSRHLTNYISEKKKINNLIEIKSIYLPGWPYSTLRSFSFPTDFGRKIDSILKKNQIDVVHAHGHHYPICWIAINSARKKGIKTILSLHGMYALNPNIMGGKSKFEELFNRTIFKKILTKTDIVIGGTTDILRYATRYGSTSNKFVIVPNGVFAKNYKTNILNKINYRNKFNLKENSIVILFVGRFEEVKGIYEFTTAMKEITTMYPQSFEILIVGGGKLETQITSRIQGFTNIHILSWQPYDTIHEIFILADIFVLSSKFEALPLTIIEAMNAHLHIIFSPVGGVKDILDGYIKKTLLPKVTSELICSSVISVMKENLYLKDDAKSYLYAESFDWKQIAVKVKDVYKNVLLE
jgi:glycosyltransferase involved in cell wall biosynthesis